MSENKLSRADILRITGMTEAEALRAERLASIPDKEIEHYLREKHDAGDPVTCTEVEDAMLAKFFPEKARTRGQRGRSQATLDLIATCSEIIAAVQPISVRGVCYKLFVAGKIDSMAKKNTQKISRLLVQAREEGVIPWEWIVDDSRRMEGGYGFKGLADYAERIAVGYRRDFWSHQPDRVIVISEKSTVAGILRPVLDLYGVPFMVEHGFGSATTVHELAQGLEGDNRHYVFLYLGDYDCSGMHMSEIDLPGRLARYGGGDFDLRRIALTAVDTVALPEAFDAKEKDPRFKWYVQQYGAEAWELDAMDPNDLRNRVQHEIEQYIDAQAWEQHQKIEAVQLASVRKIAERMAAAGA